MLKNNKNLIINILIFLILVCLKCLMSRRKEKFTEKKELDDRGCPIDISVNANKNKKSLGQRIKLNPNECYGDCECLPGFKCLMNKCRPMGTYACINAKTGECREVSTEAYNYSDWKLPFGSDFSGFQKYCRYVLNDPYEVFLKYDDIAINGGCPINNIHSQHLNQIQLFNKNS